MGGEQIVWWVDIDSGIGVDYAESNIAIHKGSSIYANLYLHAFKQISHRHYSLLNLQVL